MERRRQVAAARPTRSTESTGADGQHRPGSEAGLLDVLAQTAYVIMAVLNKVGAEHDLSLTQLRVLGILRDRRLRMATLADYLGLEKPTMTGLVDRAERRGLLARAPNATDGRAVDVYITPHGAELVESIYGRVVQLMAPLVDELTPTERRQLQALLERMLDSRKP
jgi:DNA-binding MarR family transcriptional regulator